MRGGRWPVYGRRWPWLYRGARADGWVPESTVRWAQACLAQLLGPGVLQDGILGPNTARAVAQFQTQQQLPPTGLLNGDTLNALRAACGEQQETAFRGGDATDEEASRHWVRRPVSPVFRGYQRALDPYASCPLIGEDFGRLSAAVDALKDQLRRPPDQRRIQDRANLVIGISRQIVDRLQAPHGCSPEDHHGFASSVRAMCDGTGADGAFGPWPPPRSAAEHEARRQARESLESLLNWLG